MEFKLLGVKFNLVNVVVCVALGFLICIMIGCDCMKKEGFVSGSSCTANNINVASPLAPLLGGMPSMDAGLAPAGKKGSAAPASVEGEKMFYLDENDVEYKPECCTKSVYSNSMGCACLSDSQWNYLNERAGNRTMGPTEF